MTDGQNAAGGGGTNLRAAIYSRLENLIDNRAADVPVVRTPLDTFLGDLRFTTASLMQFAIPVNKEFADYKVEMEPPDMPNYVEVIDLFEAIMDQVDNFQNNTTPSGA